MNGQDATKTIEYLLSQHQLGRLNTIQFGIVEQVWEGRSYFEIAQALGYNTDYIKQVGSALWKQLSAIVGEKVSKGNLCSIVQRYYRPDRSNSQNHWGEAIDISSFYGRDAELATLKEWVLDPSCRLVGLFGWGGVGKTSLSVKLARSVAGEFDCVVWRSLRQAPQPNDFLDDIVPILVGAETQEISPTALIEVLQQKRCLLVFDNIESILQPGEGQGTYLEGYEAYGQIFEALCDRLHQSCAIVTGREKPHGIAMREGVNLPARSILLTGLTFAAADRILHDKGIEAQMPERAQLIDFFYGHPLALKLAATTVKNLFGGDVGAFLSQGTTVFSNLWHLLDRQFDRLSPLQQQVMYWIAIVREGVTLVKLQSLFVPRQSLPPLLEALEILRDRSLIESSERGLSQQPVIMEYVTDKFIQQIEGEIITGELALLVTHPIIEACTKDYLREAQTQLILQPLVECLLTHFERQANLESHLYTLLAGLRDRTQLKTGYAAGNILNLFVHLKTNLYGYDFSRLFIRQAYLLKATLHAVDLRSSHLSQSIFAETFGAVTSVAFSPDGGTLAASDTKGDIQLWDAATLDKRADLRGHQSWIWKVAFSSDSRYLVSASTDCTVKLWDIATQACIYTDRGHNNIVQTVSISPVPLTNPSGEVQTIASVAHTTIRLFGIVPGEDRPITEISIETDTKIRGLAFSPDGQILAGVGEDLTVKFWETTTGTCLKSWTAHQGWIYAIAFSPDGSKVATASYDRTVKIWSVDAQACLHRLTGHQEVVGAIAWSPDGDWLVSSSFDKSIKLWHTQTGECLKTLLGHRNRIWDVAFHPHGHKIVSGGDDRATKIWDLDRGCCINTTIGHSKGFLSVALHPNGRYLASGAEDRTVRIWDSHSGEILQTCSEHTNNVCYVGFSPDGNLLVSCSSDRMLKIWNWRSGSCLHTLCGHKSWVWKAVFSSAAGRQTLVSCSYDRTMKIWDVATGECLGNLAENDIAMSSLAISPNSERQLLASSDYNGTIDLWDLADRCCINTLRGHQHTVWSMDFSHDGKYLVSTDYDRTIKIWSADTGACLQTLQGHRGAVLAAKFSPDDRWLISGSLDATIAIWEVATGKCLKTISGHGGVVYSVEVALLQLPGMDALKLLAFTGSMDETIKVWDLETGTCLHTWQTPSPYTGTNINGVRGLTPAQISTLVALGAVCAIESHP